MAEGPVSCRPRRTAGFSMVEMLVALLFISILMAGMVSVFKATLGNSYTSGEKIAISRRNRLAMNQLYSDVQSAGMFLTQTNQPPQGASATCPLFYILPNQTVTGYTVNGAQQYADQLFFYMDQPLPFSATLTAVGASWSDATGVATGTSVPTGATSYTVQCPNYTYAMQLYNASQGPLSAKMMDSPDVKTISPITQPPASSLSQSNQPVSMPVNGASQGYSAGGLASYTSSGPTNTNQYPHNAGIQVMFFVPSQMVHYYIKLLNLDPQNPAKTPCLVRDQGTYNPNGFVPSSEQVITENVSAFKLYLSADPGYLSAKAPTQAWAPFSAIGNAPNLTAGWTNGVLADFNTQLQACGRPGLTSTTAAPIMQGPYAGGLAWFRLIPATLRLDITTQTATQRSEYSATGKTLAYATVTRSLIITPRNFGLPLE